MPRLAELSWVQVQEYLSKDDRVILPLGATEAHGRHLGLGTDFLEADAIAQGTCEKSGVLVAPSLNYGMSHSLLGFKGTLSLRPTTLISVLGDLVQALYLHGFRRILIVNGHGGNSAAISSAWHQLSEDKKDLSVKLFEWWTDPEAYSLVSEKLGPQQGSHASPGETAFMLAICPEGVHKNLLTGNDAPVKTSRELTNMHSFPTAYPEAIMGLDPHTATAEIGRELLGKCIEICVRELEYWQIRGQKS